MRRATPFDRRQLVKGAAAAGGALWVTPTVLTLAAPPASASVSGPTFVQQVNAARATSLSMSIATPTAGVLVAAVAIMFDDAAGRWPTTPAGWTLVLQGHNDFSGNDGANLAVYWRQVGVTGTTAYTFTFAGDPAPAVGFLAAYAGATACEPAGPSASAITITKARTATMSAPTVTTTHASSRLLFVGAYHKTLAAANNASQPTGFTARGNPQFAAADGIAAYLADRPQALAGPTGAASSTLTTAAVNFAGFLSVY